MGSEQPEREAYVHYAHTRPRDRREERYTRGAAEAEGKFVPSQTFPRMGTYAHKALDIHVAIVVTCKLIPCAQVRNFVDRVRAETFGRMSDALDFVQSISRDPDAYVHYEDDGAERLKSVVWATGAQRGLAERFGDVVIQDNTAQTNRYVPGHALKNDPN